MVSEEKRNLDLVVRLAVILGHCNVLHEMLEEGSPQARRLALIRSRAESVMTDLEEHLGQKAPKAAENPTHQNVRPALPNRGWAGGPPS